MEKQLREIKEMSLSEVSIAVTADDKYAKLVYVWAYSVAKYSDRTRQYHIYIVSNSFSKPCLDKLNYYLRAFDNVSVSFVDISKMLNALKCDVTWNKDSIVYYATLLLPLALPDLHRCIYMDVDMIAQRDMGELFDKDIGVNSIGAVSIYSTSGRQYFAVQNYFHTVIGYDNAEDYFNNGVMLLDFDRIREENTLNLEKITELISKEGLLFADQDVMNIIMRGKVFYLEPNWNVGNGFSSDITEQKYLDARLDPYVIHYNGKIKPTLSFSVGYAENFWKIVREMDLYETLLMDCILENTSVKRKLNRIKNNWSYRLKNKLFFWKNKNFER